MIDVADEVTEVFRKARELDSAPPRAWITLGRLGDLDGIYPIDRAFNDGARAGFAKALAREWTGCAVRVVGYQGGSSDDEAARAACDELAACRKPGGGAVEVFRKSAERRVIGYKTESVPRPGMLYDAPVVLVTGGGRGISARIALELAKRGPVKLALVGRGPMADADLDVQAEKENIKAALKAINAKVTPVEVDRRLDPLRRADEIRKNVMQIEALGGEVRYFRADLSEKSAIVGMIEEVEAQFGPVDVVIHGAGVEESRRLADKDEAAFRRVFDGKARGGRALLDAVGPDVYFISMGSVAGRFGNAGQVDYAAANDALARVCLTRPRSLHVDWTAWDDVGMAVRGSMRSLLTDRGVDLLPADAGAGLLVDLMSAGTTGEIVVAGRLGGFSPAIDHPLLDRVELVGDAVHAARDMSLASDPWLADHAIDGVPVLPGVMGLELMAATAAMCRPGLAYAGARDVKFDQPVKIFAEQGPVTVLIEAEPINDTEVQCRLASQRTLRTGRVQRVEHFAAIVRFGEVGDVDHLPSAFFPDEVIEKGAIYERFFHGPAFQVLANVQGAGTDGILVDGRVDDTRIAEFLVTDPLLLEAGFQAAGLHRMLLGGEMALPLAIDEVRVVRQVNPGDAVTIVVYADGDRYDIDVDGPDGPALRVRGFQMISLGPLPPEKRFPEPEGGRFAAFEGLVRPKPKASSSRARSSAESVDSWLTPSEIDDLSARGTGRRIRDRLAGRVAAKRALYALTGVDPHEMRVDTASSGAPVARVPGFPEVGVSISHGDGVAVAVAVAHGRVGIDRERIAARSPAFVSDWYTVDEADRYGADPVSLTAVWTVKEAVMKAIGAGMAVHPREIGVILGVGDADVVLSGGALARHQANGGGGIAVTWRVDADDAEAEARIAA